MSQGYLTKSALGYVALPFVLAILLTGCVSSPKGGVVVSDNARYNSGNLKPYTVRGKTYHPKIPRSGYEETGLASWYGPESGGRTANGEVFNPDGLSAAHKTFPLPSIAEVTYLDTGKTIRLRINDRGPFSDGRVIDLSRGAAKALGTYAVGTARVRVKWLGPAEPLVATAAPARSQSSGDNLSYVVQLGAFSQKDNAESAQSRMEGARIERRDGLYIVYIGPYTGAAAAEGYRQAAIDAGFSGAILRRAK